MDLRLSSNTSANIAITGHVGCGHAHSHNQYIQDDSGGLAVALNILRRATGLSLNIADVRVKIGSSGYFEVETESGGVGRAYPRRGITLQESKLAKTVIGLDASLTHTRTLDAFGRFYGQGVSEPAVSFQTAVAMASLNSFRVKFPNKFHYADEDIKGNIGGYIGTVIDVDNTPVSIMAVVNATAGGIGPNEDLEGSCFGGSKKDMMKKLGMENSPTIVIEGKVYTPIYCDNLERERFFVRADREFDNAVVAECIESAGRELGHDIVYNDNVMKRVNNGLRNQTKELGLKISAKAMELSSAEYSNDKVQIIAELAEMVSQDCAGISFMSNSLHELIGGVGLHPYTSAVISLLQPKSYRDEFVFPFLTNDDTDRFSDIILASIAKLNRRYDEAKSHIIQSGFSKNLDDYLQRG